MIAEQQTKIRVTEKNLALANSDAAYRQLRDIGLGDTYICENHYVTGAVFVGQNIHRF